MNSIRIFLSSTSMDLSEHRKTLLEQANALGYELISMEEFGSRDGNALQVSLKEVEQCDVFIGLYAKRYGYIPVALGEDISITEKEYLTACLLNKPRLVFIVEESYIKEDPLLNSFRDDHDPEVAGKLSRFLQKIALERVWDKFSTPFNLAARFRLAMSRWEGWRCPIPPVSGRKRISEDSLTEQVTELLIRDKQVGISGIGGSGKTMLAQTIASEKAFYYRAGVLWLGLSASEQTLQTILYRFYSMVAGCTHDGRMALPAAWNTTIIKEWLSQAPGPLLVVIDNVWSAGVLQELLKSIPPNCDVLVTTQHAGIFNVLPHFPCIKLEPLTEEQSIKLLRDRVGDTILPSTLKNICRLHFGHPLSLEITAGLIKENGVDFAEEQISKQLRLKIKPATLTPATEEENSLVALRATLSLSYQRLSESSKERFRSLSVTPLSTNIPEQLLAGLWNMTDEDAETREDFLHIVGLFLNLGLINKDSEASFQVHPLLHHFADSAVEEEEEIEVRTRYIEFLLSHLKSRFEEPELHWLFLTPYLSHVHRAGEFLYAHIEKEVGSIRELTRSDQFEFPLHDEKIGIFIASLRYKETGSSVWNQAFQFTTMVQKYIHLRPEIQEGIHWLCMGLVAAKTLGFYKQCINICRAISSWYSERHEAEPALAYQQRTAHWYEESDNIVELASYYNSLGWMHYLKSDFDQARAAYEKTLAIAVDKGLLAALFNNMGVLFRDTGEIDASIEYLKKSIELSRAIGRDDLARSLRNLAVSIRNVGDYPEAIELLDQAIQLAREQNIPIEEEAALNSLGTVFLAQGNYKKAAEIASLATDFARRLEMPVAISNNLLLQADILYETGKYNEAISVYLEAIKLRESIDDKAGVGDGLHNLARVYVKQGDYERGIRMYYQALEYSRSEADAAITLASIAQVELTVNNTDSALEKFSKALPVLRRMKNRPLEVETLLGMAEVFERKGDHETAMQYHMQSADAFSKIKGVFNRVQVLKSEAEWLIEYKQYAKAVGKLEEALDLCQGDGQMLKRESAKIHNKLGLIYIHLREYEEAKPYLLTAESLFHGFGEKEKEAATRVNLGEVYRNTGNAARALDYFYQALPVLRNGDDINSLADLLNNIALLLTAEKDQAERISLYEECAALKLKINHFSGALIAYHNIYLALANRQRYDDALPFLYKAIDIISQIPNVIDRIDFNIEIGTDLIEVYKKTSEGLSLLGSAANEMKLHGIEVTGSGITSHDVGQLIERFRIIHDEGDYRRAFETMNALIATESVEEVRNILERDPRLPHHPGFDVLPGLIAQSEELKQRENFRFVVDFVQQLRYNNLNAAFELKEARILLEEGLDCFDRYKLEEARPLLETAFEKGLRNEELHLALGILDLISKEPESAFSHFQQVRQLYSGNAESLYWIGRLLVMQDPLSSLEYFNGAIELRKHFEPTEIVKKEFITIKTHGNIAHLLRGSENQFRLTPLIHETYFWRSFAFMKINDHEACIEGLDYAIKLEPNFYSYYYLRGLAYVELRNFEAARNDFYMATELEPHEPDLYHIRAKAFLSDDHPYGALDDLHWLIHLAPEPANLVWRAEILTGLGYFDDAIADLERALDTDPDNRDARFWLGMIHFIDENLPAANELFKKLLSDDKTNVNYAMWFAVTEFSAGATDVALKSLVDANYQTGNDPGILFWTGICRELKKEAIEARKTLTLVLELTDKMEETAYAVRLKARLMLLDQKVDKAYAYYEKAFEVCGLLSLHTEHSCLSLLFKLFPDIAGLQDIAGWFKTKLDSTIEYYENK